MWASEFENDPTLGIMEDCYNSLKTKGNGLAFLSYTLALLMVSPQSLVRLQI